MPAELFSLTIAEGRERLARQEISVLELTRACLDRVWRATAEMNVFESHVPLVNAYDAGAHVFRK